MISQEEIYDLDTETLEQKVESLELQMRKWSPRSKKKGQRCLQLAKLEIEQRQVNLLLYEFETKCSSVSFLYLNKQAELEKNLNSNQEKLNLQLKGFIKQKLASIPQPIKKTFTIPKTQCKFQYKPIKTRKIQQSTLKIKPSSKLQNRDSRMKSSSIISKASSKTQLSKIKNKQQKQTQIQTTHQQPLVFQLINEKLQKQVKQDKKIVNKVQFIENEQSISSDEHQNQAIEDSFKPQLLLINQNVEQKQQNFNLSQLLSKQQKQFEKIDSISYSLRRSERKTHSYSENKQNMDTIDYFRFPIASKKNQQQQIKDFQPINANKQSVEFEQVELQQQPDSKFISLTINLNTSSATVPVSKTQAVCFSERIVPQIPLSSSCQQRSMSQYVVNRKQKATYRYEQSLKLVKQLPAPTIVYHQIIPTFSHLFSPDSEIFINMRILVGIIDQHIKIKSSHSATINQNQYYHQDHYSQSKYANLIDISLNRSDKDSNEIEPQNSSTSLFYRVIKTKEQVYDIITNTLNRTNWYQLPHGMNLKQSWNLLWTWSKPQIDFKTLIYFQKVNHFVNNKQLSRKDLLKKNIEKIKRLGVKIKQIFNIIPDTYLLPGQTDSFIKKFKESDLQKQNIWIMKPIGLSRGRGIKLIKDLNDIYYNQPVVLQKYLKNPLLLNSYKFDMRIYVVVTNINPLQAYIYRQGFARISTEQYTLNNLDNNFIHLTNYSIQRQNVKEKDSLGGSKISLKMLKEKLQKFNIRWSIIWNQVIEIVLKSLISCMNQIPSIPNCFQLFGYDIIIDSQLKCWLLQVNSSPSLQKQYLLDELIKQQLIDDIIRLVDPISFNRTRLKQILQRRIMEVEGRKSYINTNNNSVQQLNKDLCYILDGKELRKYGQGKKVDNFVQVAPGDEYFKLIKMLQAYKNTNIVRK